VNSQVFDHTSLIRFIEARFANQYAAITVDEDPDFEYRFAGHVETGSDSISDPAMGGLI
jgi:phospholipase C